MDNYDYVELVIYDIHSIPRGRMVSRRRIMAAQKKGVGIYTGLCYFGAMDQPNVCDYFGANRNYGNGYMVPIPETLVDSLKSARGENKVGQVLCELRLPDGRLEPTIPRCVAQRQIESLADLGYTIKSTHELEFAILDTKGQFWGHSAQWADMNVIEENQIVLLDLLKELSDSGVKVDTLQAEAGPGQYEMTLDIAEGLEGPDMTSRFKSMSRVFFRKRDLRATFATKVALEGLSNGFHFNHSIWTKDGKNAFLDLNQPDRLSKVGRHWLAGLITHAPALTALCCPTINCYRRLHNPWTPDKANWGSHDRMAFIRLVAESDNNIYMECRMPSSACNAYLVMASIVAAGVDGISRQLSLDEVDQEVVLPYTLEDALKSLEDDAILVEALGKEFVECFTYTKRKFEIEPFKVYDGCSNEQLFEVEKKTYVNRI